MIDKYKMKHTEVKAVQWNGNNIDEVIAMMSANGVIWGLTGLYNGDWLEVHPKNGKSGYLIMPNGFIVMDELGIFLYIHQKDSILHLKRFN